MPQQAPLRLIKQWCEHRERGDFKHIRPQTRGFYILYNKNGEHWEVAYIGVAGISDTTTVGIKGRLQNHHIKNKKKWTHYSYFEVHDNVSGDEIRELESLFFVVFRRDPRIALANKQLGSIRFRKARMKSPRHH